MHRQVSDVDKRLAQQAGRFWSEIVQRRFDYDRPFRVSAQARPRPHSAAAEAPPVVRPRAS